MDITVYLPDEIGRRAKAEDLNLSALLRAGVIEELNRRAALAEMADEAEPVELDLETDDGEPYVGRFDGTLLAWTTDLELYIQTEDERVVAYDRRKLRYDEADADDVEWLEDWLGAFGDSERIRIMHRLGLRAVISI